MRTLGPAWNVISANGRSSLSPVTRREIEDFSRSAFPALTRIQRQLSKNAFNFRPAIGVAVQKKDKKSIRPLVVAPVESRIVQRAILDILLTVPSIRRITENPYSFGGVRKQEGAELAAVPAAIKAVLEGMEHIGARYVIRSDISSFFTRIPKATVTSVVADAVNDADFLALFSQAITVELENIASLERYRSLFPISEIGVAQGCSLSPLLGNIILGEFDQEMNAGRCRCIRYIDDFLILAPDKKTGEDQLVKAQRHLERLGMQTSSEKTQRGDPVGGFQFLGIELCNGAIRPTKESRTRLLKAVSELLAESALAFRLFRNTGVIPRRLTLNRTLYEVNATQTAWGRHYRFCNEKSIFNQLDDILGERLRRYLGAYSAECRLANQTAKRRLLGIQFLEELVDCPLGWPKTAPTPVVSEIAKPSASITSDLM
jgi:RNA-directed DNA polymerase